MFRAFHGPLTQSVENNVVVTQIGGIKGSDWLDVTLPQFTSFEAATDVVSSKLFAFLFAYANPKTGGSIGSISHRADAAITRQLKVENGSVSSILSRVINNSTWGGLWFTTQEHRRSEPLPSAPFWMVLSYAESASANREKINNFGGVLHESGLKASKHR